VVPRLTDALRLEISLGNLVPGGRLKIELIRRQYDVSAASVREALSILTGEEFVTSVDQKGFVVTSYQGERLRDLTRVRAELEAVAFGWSVANATTDWRAQIVASHFALSEAELALDLAARKSILEWDRRNCDFHLALTDGCGSPRLKALVRSHYELTRRYRLIGLTRLADTQAETERAISQQQHEALKNAAIEGQAEQGQALLREHLLREEKTGKG